MEKRMIEFLQEGLTRLQADIERYGIEERGVRHDMEALIAQKEMVEALIMKPVNLRKDGKVTIGFE